MERYRKQIEDLCLRHQPGVFGPRFVTDAAAKRLVAKGLAFRIPDDDLVQKYKREIPERPDQLLAFDEVSGRVILIMGPLV